MKKMRIFAAMAAAACLWACTKPDANTPGGNDTPGGKEQETEVTLTVSPASVEFDAEGAVRRVSVTTNQPDYTITGNPDWLALEKNGAEVTLTAAANTVNQPRTCTLTFKAGEKTATVAVSQKAGSPFDGFKNCSSAVLEYMGNTLYQFMKPTEEDYGGAALLVLSDEDENHLVLWIYTDLFASEEEVSLTPGIYTKGSDDYLGLKLAAKKLTFMPGAASNLDDEDYVAGCYYAYPVDAETSVSIPLVDGTIEVVAGNDGTYTIKADMKDEAGKSYKYAYQGEVEIDAEGAGYPGNSDRIDPTQNIFSVQCYYYGDRYEKGTSNFELYLYSGDEENYAMTVFQFSTPAVDFSENIDLTGAYSTPAEPEEGQEPQDPYAAGMLVPGALTEIIPGFSMPSGTYVMYAPGDYTICDAYGSLSLTRQPDGKYTILSMLMSQSEEMVMFVGENFSGIQNLEVEFIDGTAEEDE